MKLIFAGRHSEGGTVATFRFQPEKPLWWVAGQSIRLEIPVGYDSEERRFTISSAPYEQHVEITTRHSESRFKQALWQLQPGHSIEGYAIDGDFVWPRRVDQPLVFCVGGMGITPVYSMLKQRTHEGAPLAATLLYASRQLFVFEAYLRQLEAEHPELTIIFSRERLTIDLIRQHVPTLLEAHYYIAGASAMVDELSAQLYALSSDIDVRGDWFTY